ncbi:MAG: ABC transporter permease, partial [Verrucomicrobiota bacterium]
NSAHWHLLKQLTLRSIQQRFRGSILGWGWMIGQPLMMMAVYTIVFGLIFGGRYVGQPEDSPAIYALGIFLSLALYNFFSEVLQSAPHIILGNTVYVKKVAFPLEMLPLSAVGAPLVTMFVQIALVITGALFAGVFHAGGLLYVLFSAVALAILSLGVAFWFSALGVFIRDLQQIAGVMGLILLYASAVFYSPEMVAEREPWIWQILQFNPLIHLISASRSALLFGVEVSWLGISLSMAFCSTVLVSGYLFFRWIKSSFADVM